MSRTLRVIISLLAGIMLLFFASPTKASPPIFCFIEGQELISDTVPFIVKGRTMVPLRAIGEGLGMEVQWLEGLRAARIFTSPDARQNPLPSLIDRESPVEPLIFIDDTQIPSDVGPEIVEGRIMVPIRVITENLGMKVDWDASARHVYITRPEPMPEEPSVPTPEPGTPKEPEVPAPGTEPSPTEEPSPPELPQHQYLGISIMGGSKAGAVDLARVAFDAVASRIYPGITESEAVDFVRRARVNAEQQYIEVTTLEVIRLTSEINKSRAEVLQYSPAERDEILDFVASTYYSRAFRQI